jgi:trans-aconitate methyltransferase
MSRKTFSAPQLQSSPAPEYPKSHGAPAPPDCWLCGGPTQLRLVAARDHISGCRFDIAWCSRCQLAHTSPRPSNPESYYGLNYYGGRHGATEVLAQRRRIRILRQATRDVRRGNFIDIGCGDGTFLRTARQDGWTVAGTEVAAAPGHGSDFRVEHDLSDLADLKPVSAATLWHSLEHLPEPVAVLRQLGELMPAGAVVIVAVPNFSGLQARVGKRHWLHLDPPRHLAHFGPSALATTLHAAGFDPFLRWDQEIEYDVAGWAQTILSMMQPDQPPLFFNWLSRRDIVAKRSRLALNIGAGTVLSTLALPIVPLLATAGRGSTIILAARRRA